jgi:hypothetical protein
MSKTGKQNYRRGSRGIPKAERIVTVRSVRRDPPDLGKLSRAVVAMALRDAEAQAEVRDAMTMPAPDGGPSIVNQISTEADDLESADD